MSKALEKVGLTKEQVKVALGYPGSPVMQAQVVPSHKKKYLFGDDQKRMRRRMKTYETFIVARYLEGWHPGTISRLLSVSEESVRSRLRKYNVFQKGKVGRPIKTQSSLLGILLQDQ